MAPQNAQKQEMRRFKATADQPTTRRHVRLPDCESTAIGPLRCATVLHRLLGLPRLYRILNHTLYPIFRRNSLRHLISPSSSIPFGENPSTTPKMPRPCSVS